MSGLLSLPIVVIIYPADSQLSNHRVRWPSGLRRQLKVAVVSNIAGPKGHGFESHSDQHDTACSVLRVVGCFFCPYLSYCVVEKPRNCYCEGKMARQYFLAASMREGPSETPQRPHKCTQKCTRSS